MGEKGGGEEEGGEVDLIAVAVLQSGSFTRGFTYCISSWGFRRYFFWIFGRWIVFI